MKMLFRRCFSSILLTAFSNGAAIAVFLTLLFGCGGGGGGGGGGVTGALAPTSATLGAGGSKSFAATVTNAANKNVDWTVVEGSAGGSVTTGGLYVAPLATGTFHVRATSQEDPTKFAAAAITVTVSVVVKPINPGMTLGDGQLFTATVYRSPRAHPATQGPARGAPP